MQMTCNIENINTRSEVITRDKLDNPSGIAQVLVPRIYFLCQLWPSKGKDLST